MNHATSRNLELKVEVGPAGLDEIRARLDAAHHRVVISMHQRDRYIETPRGRLKLREIQPLAPVAGPPTAELIAYDRPVDAGSRWSSYEVVPIDPAAADRLMRGLAITHELGVTVDKRRDVVLWGNTRIHLDEVVGLGSYVELETVITGQRDDEAAAEHALIVADLGLERWSAIAGSYSDLWRERSRPAGAGQG